MIDLDIFGRGEIKRLNYELRQLDYKKQELENENKYLRGATNAQAATIERLQQEIRAQDELIRQMQETEHKLFGMYDASEKARKSLAEKTREGTSSAAAAAPSPCAGKARDKAAPTEGTT